MRFADPWLLLLLAVPLALAVRSWRRRRQGPETRLAWPATEWLAGLPDSRRVRLRRLLGPLHLLALGLAVVALARPQLPGDVRDTTLHSRNIMMVLDISSSMKATDFQPGNRVEVARKILADFVERRGGDLLGLVTFAGRAFLQAPLNPDTAALRETLARVDIGQLPDGTAIGTALALALNQLKNLPIKASTILLVTDGANNTGQPGPGEAAEAARALGVRIHAIGLSTADTSSVALNGVWRVGNTAARLTTWDEAILRRITERTGGTYYRATDPETMRQVLETIDRVERVDVRVPETRSWRELFPWLLAPALMLLVLELGLSMSLLRELG